MVSCSLPLLLDRWALAYVSEQGKICIVRDLNAYEVAIRQKDFSETICRVIIRNLSPVVKSES